MNPRRQTFAGRLGRFASFNVAQQVWLAALSLVATPILYRRLGSEAYGILAVVNLLAAQLAVLEFGFGHATIRWLAQARGRGDAEAPRRILGVSATVFGVTALAGAAILLAGAGPLTSGYFRIPPALHETAVTALRVGAVFFAATMAVNLAGAAWQGAQRFDILNVVGGAAATAQVLGSLAIVLLGYGVVYVVAWSTLVGLTTLLVHVRGLKREFPGVGLRPRWHRETFRSMAGYGALLMTAGVLTQVFLSGGPLVLGHYVWVGALPFFTVPFGLFQRLYRAAGGISSALFPLVAELDGRQDEGSLARVFVSGTRVLLLAGAATALPAVLVAGPFLHLWMGADFADQATPVLEALFLAFFAVLATVPSVELARGTGRAGRIVAYVAVLAALNVGGVALLAPRFGVAGAGAAFLASQLAGSAFLMAVTAPGPIARVLRPRLGATLAAAAGATYALHGAGGGVVFRVLAATAVAAGVVLLGYAWALDPTERDVVRRALPGS